MSYWEKARPIQRNRAVNPESIAKETGKLLDESGLESFSLRALATALGVAPASLYSRISGTSDAFDLALDYALGADVAVQHAIENGQALDVLTSLYHHLLEHPWSTQIIAMCPPRGPAYLALSEALVQQLNQANRTNPLALAYAATNLVIGSALTDQAARLETKSPVDGTKAHVYRTLHAGNTLSPEDVLIGALHSLLDSAGAGPKNLGQI